MTPRGYAHGLLLVLPLLLASCGGPSGPDPAARAEARRAELRESLQERLEAIEERAASRPLQAADHRGDLEVVRLRAASQDPPIELDGEIDRVRSVIEQARERAVERAVEEAIEASEAAVESEDFESALQALEPPEAILGTEAAGRLRTERRRVRRLAEAHRRYRAVVEQSQRLVQGHNHDMALGVLEAYTTIERYRDTPWAEQVEAAMESVREEAASTEDGGAGEGMITFVGSSADDLTSFYYSQPTRVESAEGAMVVDAGGGAVVCRTKGSADAWGDADISLEFRIESGSELRLWLRGESAADPSWEWTTVRLPASRYGGDAWHRLELRMRGNEVVLSEVSADGVRERTIQTEGDRGGFGLVVPPGARVRFRNVYAQVLTWEEPPDEGAEEEEEPQSFDELFPQGDAGAEEGDGNDEGEQGR